MSNRNYLRGNTMDVYLVNMVRHTTEYWNSISDSIPPRDWAIVYTDYRIEDGKNVPGIKIADGTSKISELPFITDWEDEKIEELEDYVRGLFLGETTTALYDGYASPSIVIDGEVVVAKNGNIVVYNRREFIWDESNGKWVELGIAVFVPGTGNNSAQQAGTGAVASGASSVAEGSDTVASGGASHAEGQGTMASGNGSHAEGVTYNNIDTSASADAAHAEGAGVVVKGQAAHGEGLLNVAGRTQEEAVAALTDFPNLGGTTEEKVSKLIGFASHSEGSSTRALGTSSHAEGNSTQALVNATHAEGDTTTASGEAAHSEGYNTTASGNQSHSEGFNTQATANQAHSEGKKTIASAENAHSEGNETKAVGNASHSEGYRTYAYGAMSHIEGTSSTLVSDTNAASESVESIWKENGRNFSLSRGQGSHVEGKNCLATGDWSHAEGVSSLATENGSHAEGSGTASGSYAHAEGCSIAYGSYSHAEGYLTTTSNNYEHASGIYNRSNKKTSGTIVENAAGSTLLSVGIGTGSGASSRNAFEVMQNGDVYVKGVGGYNGTNPATSGIKTVQQLLSTVSLASDSGTSAINLNAGTKYKLSAGNGSVIFTTPASSADNIFWATHGTSTYNDIKDALDAGKLVVMKYQVDANNDYILTATYHTHHQPQAVTPYIYFTAPVDGDSIAVTRINNADWWDSVSVIRLAEYSGTVEFPAGKYKYGTYSYVFISHGNLIWVGAAGGSASISGATFYECYMKSLGSYDATKAASLSWSEKATELAYAIGGHVIMKQPDGTGLMTITNGLYHQVVIDSSTTPSSISSFVYGESASGTRISVAESTVSLIVT